MNYVDVFISHKMEDADKALALQKVIQDDLKFSCYIDADDPEIAKLKKEKSVDKRALADLLRGKLRNCRCFIYAYSTQSLRSRWMQWELGFFDGRWGPRQIGLYDLDEGRAALEVQTTGADDSGPGVPEYLHIYSGLQRHNLQAFLETACSARGLADRADVDVDRVAALLAGMTRDPVNSMIDAWEYMIALQQLFWSRLLPRLVASPGNFGSRKRSDQVLPDAGPLWQIPMGMSANLRNWLRPLADAAKPPPEVQKRLDASIGASKEGAEDALVVSRPR